jgi:hypothetical protein
MVGQRTRDTQRHGVNHNHCVPRIDVGHSGGPRARGRRAGARHSQRARAGDFRRCIGPRVRDPRAGPS